MSDKITSNERTYLGCWYLAFTFIGVIAGIHLFAETAYLFNTIMLYLLSFLFTTFALNGLAIFSAIPALIKSILKFSLKPMEESDIEGKKWTKGRIWVVFPINLFLFWADSRFLLSCSDTDIYIYIGVGFLYALAIYIMTKNDYYNPSELEFSIGY